MAQILVLYNQPPDPAAFDRYYFETHVPIAKRLPKLRSYAVSSGKPQMLAGNNTPHLVAELDFDSMADLQAAAASAEGMAATADLSNFAQAGATILILETRQL
jgi:uncharacterized protein (TIGR02118 family)